MLVPALAAAGGTGFSIANERRASLIGAKTKRMLWTALNGLLVLVPSALFLAYKTRAGAFDASFYAAQVLELAAQQSSRCSVSTCGSASG